MTNNLLAVLLIAFILSMGMIAAPVFAVPHGDHDDNGNADNGQLGPGGDPDNDGIKNKDDNCDSVANADQTDSDNDGLGDACDSTPNGPDSDGDGVPDVFDACPDVAGDGPDGCPIVVPPTDSDGDGVSDDQDACPDVFGDGPDGCPVVVPPTDTDGDGVNDDVDACPDVFGDGPDGCPLNNGGGDDGNQTGGGDGNQTGGDNGNGGGNQTGGGDNDNLPPTFAHAHGGHHHNQEFAHLMTLRAQAEITGDYTAYDAYLNEYLVGHPNYDYPPVGAHAPVPKPETPASNESIIQIVLAYLCSLGYTEFC